MIWPIPRWKDKPQLGLELAYKLPTWSGGSHGSLDSTWDRLLCSLRPFSHRAGGLWFRWYRWYRVEGDSGLPLAVKQLR